MQDLASEFGLCMEHAELWARSCHVMRPISHMVQWSIGPRLMRGHSLAVFLLTS